jgi:ABC-type antimicrobial peptide transport system permease subunit
VFAFRSFANGTRLVWTVNRGTRPYDAMSPADLADWARMNDAFEQVGGWLADSLPMTKASDRRRSQYSATPSGKRNSLLKRGVTFEHARTQARLTAARLRETYPAAETGLDYDLQPLREHLVGDTRPLVFVLFGAVALLLTIACVNLASLMLVRASAREGEIGVRLALGANPRRIVGQLLIESLLLGAAGVAIGLVIAQAIISGVVGLQGSALPAFAAAALLLAVIGIYGVVAYVVRGRGREIAIRMALGADDGQMVRLVVRDALTVVALGIVVGVGMSLVVVRSLGSLLYGLPPSDPATFLITICTLVVVASIAAWLPGRHAARISPLLAMRPE